ncbi:hypothetical protein [Haloquadratum walsbyi]|jgi:hypothetical protein|uniref:Uncharacterized protein n=1 Tax=Haloquadratum walsbyi J07HQW2 TaxID=1238425 RepID=U1PLG2_9EURY|nr:hypothetical protein [Haloquadratum walsbyi]ERG94537.1 MAG: hypothetical protein J07HQW2_00972 [Haloquadratum walsbyi J07HQW2]
MPGLSTQFESPIFSLPVTVYDKLLIAIPTVVFLTYITCVLVLTLSQIVSMGVASLAGGIIVGDALFISHPGLDSS